MVRLSDVAKLAGVSAGTVSNVLNGRTQTMGAEILLRVQKAITDLGYQPNLAARSLKTGQTPLIGLLVPSIEYPSWSRLAREVEKVSYAEYALRIIVGNTYRDPRQEKSFLQDLLSHGIRGVIIVSPLLEQKHFEESIKRGLIAVSYDQIPSPGTSPLFDYVSIDHFEATRIAVNHLIDNGHKRLAYVTASGKSSSRQKKIEGFLSATNKANLSGTSEVIEGKAEIGYGDDEMPRLGYEVAIEIATRRIRPTGIVTLNDMLAVGIITGLMDRGVRVPEDISVVGIDDLLLSQYISPGLTSVRYPITEMAKTMVDRIVYRLGNPIEKPQEFGFQAKLIKRGSVANLGTGAVPAVDS